MSSRGQEEDKDEDSDCAENDIEDNSADLDIAPRIKSYKEAIVALEDVVIFLQHKGNIEEAMSLGSTIDDICMHRNHAAVQTTLDSFFSQH